jgi:hypothetical protein
MDSGGRRSTVRGRISSDPASADGEGGASGGVVCVYGREGADSSPVTLNALSTSTVTRWPLVVVRWAS